MTLIPTVGIADEYGWNIPIESMYGIYANIGSILMVNVTIYSIQGSYGIWKERMVQHDSTRLKQRSSTRNRPGTTRPPGGLVSSWANLFSALPHSTANEIKWLYPLQWSLVDLQYKSPRQVQSTQVHKHFQFGNCGSSKKPSFGKPWFSATFPSSFTDWSS